MILLNRTGDIIMKMKIKIIIFTLFITLLTFTAYGEVLFEDNFETGNLSHTDTASGTRWGETRHSSTDDVVVTADEAHSGLYSLKFFFAGNANTKDDAWAEQRFVFGEPQTNIYMRYYIKFPANYDIRDTPSSDNTKFFYMWGNNYSDPMMTGMEIDNNEKAYFKAKISGYPHVLDCAGNTGGVPGINSWHLGAEHLNKWICFEFHIKHDSGSGDGVLQFWVDGTLVIDGKNLSWAGAPCSPGYFLNGYLMGWSNSGFDENTIVYIDDIVFSTDYIGLQGENDNKPKKVTGFHELK